MASTFIVSPRGTAPCGIVTVTVPDRKVPPVAVTGSDPTGVPGAGPAAPSGEGPADALKTTGAALDEQAASASNRAATAGRSPARWIVWRMIPR